jgi:hypothetical protein
MHLAKVRIEFECTSRRGARFSRRFGTAARAQEGLDRIDVGEASVRHGVVRCASHRLLEEVGALVHLRIRTDQKFTPLEIKSVRLWIARLESYCSPPTILDSEPLRQDIKSLIEWWPGVELNHRHADFQSLLQIDLSY